MNELSDSQLNAEGSDGSKGSLRGHLILAKMVIGALEKHKEVIKLLVQTSGYLTTTCSCKIY